MMASCRDSVLWHCFAVSLVLTIVVNYGGFVAGLDADDNVNMFEYSTDPVVSGSQKTFMDLSGNILLTIDFDSSRADWNSIQATIFETNTAVVTGNRYEKLEFRGTTVSDAVDTLIRERTSSCFYASDWNVIASWKGVGYDGALNTNTYQMIVTAEDTYDQIFFIYMYGQMNYLGTDSKAKFSSLPFDTGDLFSTEDELRTGFVENSNVGLPGVWIISGYGTNGYLDYPAMFLDGELIKYGIFDFNIGDTAIFECGIRHSSPLVKGFIATCPGGITEYSPGLNATAVLTVTEAFDAQDCHCLVIGFGNLTTFMTFNVTRGPETVNLEFSLTPQPPALCSGDFQQIIAHCSVLETDYNPHVGIVLTKNGQEQTAMIENVSNGRRTAIYTLNHSQLGNVSLECTATNTADPSLNAKNETTIVILEKQNHQPTITVEGVIIANGSSAAIVDGVTVRVTCEVPDDTSLALDCNAYANSSTSAKMISVEFITVDSVHESCVCTSNACSTTLETNIGLDVISGPHSVHITIPEASQLYICPATSVNVKVRCIAGASPGVSMTLTIPGMGLTLDPTSNSDSGLSQAFWFEFIPMNSGIFQLTCSANNTGYISFGASKTSTFEIIEPLEEVPVMTTNGNIAQMGAFPDLIIGETLNVTCYENNSLPVNVTLYCGGVTYPAEANESSISVEVTKAFHQSECVCQMVGCHNVSTNITFNVIHGPTSVLVDIPEGNHFDLCPLRDNRMTIQCAVPMDDGLYPGVSVLLQDPQSEIDSISNSTVGASHSFVFSYRLFTVGIFEISCNATNTANTNFVSLNHTRIFVNETEEETPVMTVNGNIAEPNGYHDIILGKTLNVTCYENNSLPVTVSLKCGGIVYPSEVNESSISVQVTKAFHQSECVCQIVGCHNVSTHVNINVIHGPTRVFLETPEGNNFDLCPLRDNRMAVQCAISTDDGFFPGVAVFLQDPNSKLEPISNSIDGPSHKFLFSYRPPNVELVVIFCNVTNTVVHANFVATDEKAIFVNEVAEESPNITVNGEVVEANGYKDIILGETVNVTCHENNSLPVSVTLYCGGVTYPAEANESSISVEVTKAFHQSECVCQMVGCHNVSTNVNFNVIFGPSTVTPSLQDRFKLCPNENDKLQMQCDVQVDDAYPSPSMILKGALSGGDVVPYSTNTASGANQFQFMFRPEALGTLSVTCRSTNTMHDPFFAQVVDTVEVFEPPSDAPVLFIDGIAMTNGSLHYLYPGQDIEVKCLIENGGSEVTNVTVTCPSMTSAITGINETSTTLTVNDEFDNGTCVCETSGCFLTAIHFNTRIAFGPTTLQVRQEGNPFYACPNESAGVTVVCTVPNNNVQPGVKVSLQGLPSGEISPDFVTPDSSGLMHVFQFDQSTGVESLLKCVALNEIFDEFNVTAETTLVVYEPPRQRPVLRVSSSQSIANNTNVNITLGQRVQVTCNVNGGFPLVSNVTLKCADLDSTSQTTEASLSFEIIKSMDQHTCECRAQHVTGCYELHSQFTIQVWYATVLTNFDANSESSQLEVAEGTSVTLTCDAEGLPLPDITINSVVSERVYNDRTKLTSTNFYTRRYQEVVDMSCRHTDVYKCSSDNGVSSLRSLAVTVVCPPLPLLEGVTTYPLALLKSGEFWSTFDIISHPNPTNYRLVKRRTPSGPETELESVHYTVRIEELNTLASRLSLNGIDFQEDGKSTYTLIIDNGVGSALRVDFDTTRSNKPAEGYSEYELGIIPVSTLAILAVAIIIGVAIGYCFWYWRATRKSPKKQRKHNDNNHDHYHITGARPHTSKEVARVWMPRRGY